MVNVDKLYRKWEFHFYEIFQTTKWSNAYLPTNEHNKSSILTAFPMKTLLLAAN